MISSFGISLLFFVLAKTGHGLPFAQTVLISVGFTTVCWLITAFVSAETSQDTLISFYKKVHPAGVGWTKIRRAAGVSEVEASRHSDHMGMATLGWMSGCIVIWSSLFAIGNFLYGRTTLALTLTAVFVVSGITLVYVINRLWDKKPAFHTE